ncbi:hypothetical protein FUAX_41670 (plasmid) [Fulvitalea axinellae]|uniref:Sigma-70 family RNA polymerase sigma factor n=1 Tax=Fulvitalea axinellae TaxID=1182444 RepID=A0AAU9CQR7_9BACT|nr:hypothetical protein FUAX_41670 [Fulvitalea axinellae]
MSQTECVSQYQALLYRVAYNILGNRCDAEDAVQDVFANWFRIENTSVRNAKAYLLRAVRNTSLNLKRKTDALTSSDREIEETPETTIYDKAQGWAFMAEEKAEEIREAVMMMYGKLSAPERGVYVLREGFDFDYSEIAEIFEKKRDHCRQLLLRAKKRLSLPQASKASSDSDNDNGLGSFMQRFNKACQKGEMSSLIGFLQSEISAKE